MTTANSGTRSFAIILISMLIMGVGTATHAPHIEDPVLKLPSGFEATLIYQPSEHDQGSWVSMTEDDRGNLLVSDQYGYLYEVDVSDQGKQGEDLPVRKLDVQIGHAQGLLWAYGGLYVSVNADSAVGGTSSGIYKVVDSSGDGELDSVNLLLQLEGAGEHGPHALVKGVNGDPHIYFVAGNHTDLPRMDRSRVPYVWDEDNLLNTIRDPGGHAFDRKAPGGWIARTDSLGDQWELMSIGFRNTYDMAFNRDGELFVYDSDMEWDMGMPWYKPTRVLHITSGSEFGWRTGSSKWEAYYPDNLPAVVDIGQGSPTGVFMGYGAKFPARYQDALYIFDWSFGTMYAIHLTPDGGSYSGEIEEFLSGTPLPLTDGLIGNDGAMYFLVGGRRIDSGLYRVTYTGSTSTSASAVSASLTPEATLRRELEALHGTDPDPALVEAAWEHLSHADRHVRFAARTALENQPAITWSSAIETESNSMRRIQSVIALARVGNESMKRYATEALLSTPFETLEESAKLDMLRAYSLVFSRLGSPDYDHRDFILQQLDDSFPSSSARMNRDLARLLVHLEAPDVADRLVTMLLDSRMEQANDIPILSEEVANRGGRYTKQVLALRMDTPNAQKIAYAYALSELNSGWTTELRRSYLEWFEEELSKGGGNSYRGFLDAMRGRALNNLTESEAAELGALAASTSLARTFLTDLPTPEGPGREWNRQEINRLMQNQTGPRSFERGERMYRAALCAACHTMNGQGGNAGPDLTQAGNRFNPRDLAGAVTQPSYQIVDQYGNTTLTLKDGSSVTGRILARENGVLIVAPNPFDLSQTIEVSTANVAEETASPVSSMPPGLFNRLNGDEVLDLMTYIMSAANPEDEAYK